MTTDRPRAHPPETTEGWYALHQVFAWDGPALGAMLKAPGIDVLDSAERLLTELAAPSSGGWAALLPPVRSSAPPGVLRFPPTPPHTCARPHPRDVPVALHISRTAHTPFTRTP